MIRKLKSGEYRLYSRSINPKTGKPFTRDQFVSFAQDYLGVDVMFWAVDSPWLRR